MTFDETFIMSHFSLGKSADGKQPTAYNLFGGSCENRSELLLEVDDGKLDFPERDLVKPYSRYCFEFWSVSGYVESASGSDRPLIQQRILLKTKELQFWKCKGKGYKYKLQMRILIKRVPPNTPP